MVLKICLSLIDWTVRSTDSPHSRSRSTKFLLNQTKTFKRDWNSRIKIRTRVNLWEKCTPHPTTRTLKSLFSSASHVAICVQKRVLQNSKNNKIVENIGNTTPKVQGFQQSSVQYRVSNREPRPMWKCWKTERLFIDKLDFYWTWKTIFRANRHKQFIILLESVA